MEVDISQIGQNFAVQSANQTAVRASEKSEDNPQQQQPRVDTAEIGKANAQSADTNGSLDSDPKVIEKALAEISEFVQSNNRKLAFSVDEDSQRPVVKVKDSESGEVIRQIPSEEVLALSQRIKELQTDVGAAVGVLFNKQV